MDRTKKPNKHKKKENFFVEFKLKKSKKNAKCTKEMLKNSDQILKS